MKTWQVKPICTKFLNTRYYINGLIITHSTDRDENGNISFIIEFPEETKSSMIDENGVIQIIIDPRDINVTCNFCNGESKIFYSLNDFEKALPEKYKNTFYDYDIVTSSADIERINRKEILAGEPNYEPTNGIALVNTNDNDEDIIDELNNKIKTVMQILFPNFSSLKRPETDGGHKKRNYKQKMRHSKKGGNKKRKRHTKKYRKSRS